MHAQNQTYSHTLVPTRVSTDALTWVHSLAHWPENAWGYPPVRVSQCCRGEEGLRGSMLKLLLKIYQLLYQSLIITTLLWIFQVYFKVNPVIAGLLVAYPCATLSSHANIRHCSCDTMLRSNSEAKHGQVFHYVMCKTEIDYNNREAVEKIMLGGFENSARLKMI